MIHHIQIIGEAASKLTPAFLKTHQQVPWPLIIKMRHVLVHDYLGRSLGGGGTGSASPQETSQRHPQACDQAPSKGLSQRFPRRLLVSILALPEGRALRGSVKSSNDPSVSHNI